MLVRQIVVPATTDQLWNALTEPESVSAWFGSRVEWDLIPGGRARFVDDDGTIRCGVVDRLLPGRHLSFRWWPEDQGDDGTSRVAYDLEPDDDGTRLTVTEQPLPPSKTAQTAETASISPAAHVVDSASWSRWDSRLFGCWAQAAAPMLVGRAVR
jgi:uncharacterized protein YndB with AHSA1/START domain